MTYAAPVQFARSGLDRRKRMIVAGVVLALAGLLYFEWRMVSAGPVGEVAEQDTMCMASRIGLPCR